MSIANPYPYPSNVCAPNFITVKLSGRDMYGLWKTQMMCLLKSHDMIGFINGKLVSRSSIGTSGGSMDDDRMLWERSDALVQGWILGSLSEEAALNVFLYLTSKRQRSDFTAKLIWDQLEIMFGEQSADQKEEREGGASSHDADGIVGANDLEKDIKEARDRAQRRQQLYVAAESGSWEYFDHKLKNLKAQITEVIGVNGNTSLHIAVATVTASDEFLKSMLNQLQENIRLSDIRNSDGSTLLHIAASVGNIQAAKILVNKCPDLLSTKDNKDCTPLDIIRSNPKSEEMCLYLLKPDSETPDVEKQENAIADRIDEEFLVNAISSGDFKLAKRLLKNYNALRSHAVLMAIVQNWPSHFGLLEYIIYEWWRKPILYIVTRGSMFSNSNLQSVMIPKWRKGKGADVDSDVGYTFKRLISIFIRIAFAWPIKAFIKQCMKIKVFRKRFDERDDARELLDNVCALIKFSNDPNSYSDFYTKPVLEAVKQDTCDVVEQIVFWFPNAIMIVDEEGHNLVQVAWKHRALYVSALFVKNDVAKHTSLSQKIKDDPSRNNFLHYVARLGPTHKLGHVSGPAFQLQRELRWFKAAQIMVPQGIKEKNLTGETPEMVFTREHKKLVIEGTDWMKNTANAYIITSVLIITIMFAAAITVPGGDEKGAPNLHGRPAFYAFMVWVSLSMVTSMTSLLLSLSIVTSRFEEKNFFLKLPLILMISLVNLVLSATFMILAFAAALFLMFGEKNPWTFSLIVPLIGLPVVGFLIYESTLLHDLLASTGQFDMVHIYTDLKVLGRIFV